jgi:hypothetical protein
MVAGFFGSAWQIRDIRPDPSGRLELTAERRWSGVGDFKYGQWRYQLVEACPRDLTGIV